MSVEYEKLTEEDRAALLRELDGHQEGTAATGRWLDENGEECDESDEGASWYEYDDEENALWMRTMVSMMDRMRKILTKEKQIK